MTLPSRSILSGVCVCVCVCACLVCMCVCVCPSGVCVCGWVAGRRISLTTLCEHSVRWPSNPGKKSRKEERWGVRWKKGRGTFQAKEMPRVRAGNWLARGWSRRQLSLATAESWCFYRWEVNELVRSPVGSKRKNWACTEFPLSHRITSPLIAF